MKLYAIKRKGCEFPYSISYRRDIDLYPTLDGCKKAISYERMIMKKIHNKETDISEYQILEYELDLDNYKVIDNEN